MSSDSRIRLLAALTLAIVLVVVGVSVGTVWQTRHHDEPVPSVSDIGFAQDMSTHHDQAILMARTISLKRRTDPAIRGLADQIVITQTAEAATMRGWLQWFGLPLTAEQPMSWMIGHATHEHGRRPVPDAEAPPMPGSPSIDELGRLTSATGRVAEILFLQLMIRHHRGGLTMAESAYNDARSSPTTKQLALTMMADQGNEIGRMTMLLMARDAEPLPA